MQLAAQRVCGDAAAMVGEQEIGRLASPGCGAGRPSGGRRTTIPDPAATRADRIRRDFTGDASKLNTRWCGDIARHEALIDREEMQDLVFPLSQQRDEAGGSLTHPLPGLSSAHARAPGVSGRRARL